MTKMTLLVTYDNGITLGIDSDDFDSLTKRFHELAEVSALASLNAAGLGATIVPDTRQTGPAQSDPWGEPGPPQRQAQTRPQPTAQNGTPQNQAQDQTVTVQTPNGLQVWTLNPNNSPWCGCGQQTALVHGTTKAGKPYNAYRCAKGSGPDWRSKCDYNEWV